MDYLSYLNPVETEISIEKLDKVAKTLNEKFKYFVKFFVILIGWFVFNIIFSLFVSRTHSLSLDTYRMIADGLRSLETQDFFLVITLIFENKIGYVIAIAAVIACGSGYFFVRFFNSDNRDIVKKRVNTRSKYFQTGSKNTAYVVSYKQQVAFLA